ncbi:PBS lyase HEAT-like repeat domain protein [Candidatus Vecturithrix granuli]|uniref:PBS lyase HEAT-like repeat domain protein n=1 Tax=Vecturithrix granuli TaxID=1499967 RepID=A0A081C908_VECG1|nr:PBS lyase HEAT-like repeat domain protein [Candidatus Vecturithrix granuli]
MIASPRYFEKAWAQEELRTLLELELAGKIERIIPIWHQIGKAQILQRFPSLGHCRATSTDTGLEQVALEILKAVDPEKYDEAHPIFLEQQRKAVRRFLEAIEEEFKCAPIFHPPHRIVLQNHYIPIEVTLERRYRHEMVLADPGMGKTALLKMEAMRTAPQARQWLENREKNVDEVSLPIFLKLFDLTQKPDAELVETILQQLQHRYQKNFEPVKALVRRKLEQGTCLLLLDALDEAPSEQRLKLAEHLNIFARHFSCPIICTSRIVGYDSEFLRDAKKVEIIPFTRKQIEQYIEIWFNNLRSAEALLSPQKQSFCTPEGLIRELRQRPQIHGLAQNPLLLSLLCSLYQEDQLTLPARRVQIYEQVVQYILYDWRRVSQRRLTEKTLIDAAWIEAKLELLEQLAYQFSCEDKEIFSMRELLTKIEACKGDTALKHHDAPDIIKELSQEDGIIQQLDGEGRNARYIFLHRTFQEYLTASYLNQQKNGLEIAKDHFWDYDWHETLILFAGLSDDPTLFLNTLLAERDDIFHTLLLLAGKCLAECPQLEMPQLIDRIYHVWRSFLYCEFAEPTVVTVAQTHPRMLMNLLYALYDSDEGVRLWAVIALGEVGDLQAVDSLLAALHDPSEHVRSSAAWVIGDIDDARVMEGLQALIHDQQEDVRRLAVLALCRLGDARTGEGILSTFHDENSRWQMGEQLRRLGDRRLMDSLLNIIYDQEEDTRRTVTKTLKQTRSRLVALHNPNILVRSLEVWMLEKIGTLDVLEKLLHRLDIDIYDRRIFPVVRRLAIKFSRMRPRPACLPVYSQPLFLRLFRKELWRVRIFWSLLINLLRQMIDGLKKSGMT